MTGKQNQPSNSEAIGRRARRGFNLIEAAIVLAVVGGVIGGVWVAASAVREGFKINKTIEIISLCASKMREVLKQVPAYSYADGASLNNLAIGVSVLPSDSQGPFGLLEITYETGFGGDDFAISVYGLKTAACVSIVRRFANASNVNGLARVVFFPQYRQYTSFPINVNTIDSECKLNTGKLVLQYNY